MQLSIATGIGFDSFADLPPAILATYLQQLTDQAEKNKG